MYLYKLFFLIIVSIFFIGCGNGSFDSTSSSSGNAVFSLMAVDDPIINAQVSASNCSGFTQDGNGTYTLTGCSKKPANIIISGGFIDLNGDSIKDANESKLSFPLILNTDQFPGSDNFVVTPLTTILSSLPSGTTLEDYATKLGLTKEDLFVDLHTKYGKNSVKHNILQEINLVFEQASKAGIGKSNPNDFISFLNDYAEIIHNADITDGNSTALLAKAKENFSKPENLAKYKNKYGTLVFTGFVVDTRDTKTFEEQIDERNQQKSKLIFSGFIYDDFIPNAIVTLKDSKDLNVTLAQTTSDDLGYYSLEVDDNLIHEDSVLLFEASKDLNVSDVNNTFNNNIKLVSAIAVKEIKKSFDTEIGISDNKDITISNVTTAKYVIIKVLDTNNTILEDPDKLIEAKLELENNSEKQDILLSVSAVIKTLIDGNAIIEANNSDNNNTLDYMTNELLVIGANDTLDVNISSNDTITEEAVNEMATAIQDDEVLSEQLDSSTQAIEVYTIDKSLFENRSFDLVFNDENTTKSTIIFYQNNVFKEIKNNQTIIGSWGLSASQERLELKDENNVLVTSIKPQKPESTTVTILGKTITTTVNSNDIGASAYYTENNNTYSSLVTIQDVQSLASNTRIPIVEFSYDYLNEKEFFQAKNSAGELIGVNKLKFYTSGMDNKIDIYQTPSITTSYDYNITNGDIVYIDDINMTNTLSLAYFYQDYIDLNSSKLYFEENALLVDYPEYINQTYYAPEPFDKFGFTWEDRKVDNRYTVNGNTLSVLSDKVQLTAVKSEGIDSRTEMRTNDINSTYISAKINLKATNYYGKGNFNTYLSDNQGGTILTGIYIKGKTIGFWVSLEDQNGAETFITIPENSIIVFDENYDESIFLDKNLQCTISIEGDNFVYEVINNTTAEIYPVRTFDMSQLVQNQLTQWNTSDKVFDTILLRSRFDHSSPDANTDDSDIVFEVYDVSTQISLIETHYGLWNDYNNTIVVEQNDFKSDSKVYFSTQEYNTTSNTWVNHIEKNEWVLRDSNWIVDHNDSAPLPIVHKTDGSYYIPDMNETLILGNWTDISNQSILVKELKTNVLMPNGSQYRDVSVLNNEVRYNIHEEVKDYANNENPFYSISDFISTQCGSSYFMSQDNNHNIGLAFGGIDEGDGHYYCDENATSGILFEATHDGNNTSVTNLNAGTWSIETVQGKEILIVSPTNSELYNYNNSSENYQIFTMFDENNQQNSPVLYRGNYTPSGETKVWKWYNLVAIDKIKDISIIPSIKLNLSNINLSEHNIASIYAINSNNDEILLADNLSNGSMEVVNDVEYGETYSLKFVLADGSVFWFNFINHKLYKIDDGSNDFDKSIDALNIDVNIDLNNNNFINSLPIISIERTLKSFIGSIETAGYASGITISQDGTKAYIADEENGLVIVDITTSESPTIIGSIDTAGYAKDVTISQDETKAYIADEENGLVIVDITTSESPSIIGSIDTAGYVSGVIISQDGTKAYIADEENGLVIVDISTSESPTIIGSIETAGYAQDVIISQDETKAYIADEENGLVIVDISTSESPTIIGSIDTAGSAYGVTISQDETKAYIADGSIGLVIVDISISESPSIIGSIETVDEANGVIISQDGTKAYIADDNGLVIVDISTSESPSIIGSIDTAGSANGVTISQDGTKAYIADGSNGLVIVDIITIASPTILGLIDTVDEANGVIISQDETKAYIADNTKGLVIVDISTSESPTIIGSIDTAGSANGVTISQDGTKAYIADGSNGLVTVDISTSESPTIIGSIDTAGYANGVIISQAGTKAYIADGENGLVIVDISTSESPTIIGSIDTPGSAYGVTISQDETKAYIADYDNGLVIIDISTSESPTIIGSIDTAGSAYGVTISQDETKAYIADDDNGLVIIDISTSESPTIIGTYTYFNVYAEGVTISQDGTKAYIADEVNGLIIVDITVSELPIMIEKISTEGEAYDVAISQDGTKAYIADYYNGLVIANITLTDFIQKNSISYDVNVIITDTNEDNVTLSIVSEDTNLVTVTPNWTNPISYPYNNLNYTVTPITDSIGKTNIIIDANDGSVTTSYKYYQQIYE